jgi:Na+/melibiose symporter-like transporter
MSAWAWAGFLIIPLVAALVALAGAKLFCRVDEHDHEKLFARIAEHQQEESQ